jgi:hypothetical protein
MVLLSISRPASDHLSHKGIFVKILVQWGWVGPINLYFFFKVFWVFLIRLAIPKLYEMTKIPP